MVVVVVVVVLGSKNTHRKRKRKKKQPVERVRWGLGEAVDSHENDSSSAITSLMEQDSVVIPYCISGLHVGHFAP